MPLIQMHERLHLPFATTRRHELQTSQVMSLNQGVVREEGPADLKVMVGNLVSILFI